MGFLTSLFRKKEQSPVRQLRDLLYGDERLESWPPDSEPSGYPWDAFISARKHFASGEKEAATRIWQEIVAHPGLEPRHYLQAWHFLRQQGHHPPVESGKQVLGVVVEVALPDGLELLAAYADHTARYHHHSGGGVVWEHADDSLDHVIDEILAAAQQVADGIGPWREPRPPAPPTGEARLSFLTASGLHFGQATLPALEEHPTAGPVLQHALVLMQALIERAHPDVPTD